MLKIQTTYILLLALIIAPICLGNEQSHLQVSLVEAFPNLRFNKPLFLTHSNDGSNRIFVIEQAGIIKVFPNDINITHANEFLNIENRVSDVSNEMGLLGLAIHPDYANNGFFFVNYTSLENNQRRTVISRFTVSSNNPDMGNPDSEFKLLQFSQPFSNHNGGMLQFGNDGLLYISTGDGGGTGDPRNNAQNRTNLLGNILRIDVDTTTGALNYGIPPDNPYVGNNQGFREEIFAWGLRNPWRFSIDPITNEIWAGDVGQNLWEEIDLIEKDKNYGWRIMEGTHCFNPSTNCDTSSLTKPIVDYGHFDDKGDFVGCSVTGGYIYRGSLQPNLVSAYIYGDYCSGNIWMLKYENRQLLADSLIFSGLVAGGISPSISSFGVDENNELYVLDHSRGIIYRFSESLPNMVNDDKKNDTPANYLLAQNYPNPFNPSTTINFTLATSSHVEIAVYNILGQKIKVLIKTEFEPGSYKTVWDGRHANGERAVSGIYFYQFKTNSHVQTRKMILTN